MTYVKILDTADNSITWCRGDAEMIEEMVSRYNNDGMISCQVEQKTETRPEIQHIDLLTAIDYKNVDDAYDHFYEGEKGSYFILEYEGDEI